MPKPCHCIKIVLTSNGQNWNCKSALLRNCTCNKWGLCLKKSANQHTALLKILSKFHPTRIVTWKYSQSHFKTLWCCNCGHNIKNYRQKYLGVYVLAQGLKEQCTAWKWNFRHGFRSTPARTGSVPHWLFRMNKTSNHFSYYSAELKLVFVVLVMTG